MMVEKANQGLPRAVEVCFAALGLLFSGPVLAISAIGIKLTSNGPIIFRQQRVGKNGELFDLFKFRTMNSAPGSLVTSANDDRITPIGRTLRQLKIDELPQLWNVLRGDMSLVGPRPEVPALVDTENSIWTEVLSVRPGLTDPVTLRMRNEEQLLADFSEDEAFYSRVVQPFKLRGYLDFVRNRSWITDLATICLTLIAVILPNRVATPSRQEMLEALAE